MNLKEALAQEAAAVFCNPAEFGESVNLDGHAVIAVIGEVVTRFAHEVEPDIPRLERTLFVPQSALPEGYEPEGTATINGEQWAVGTAECSCGMFEITVWRRL